MHGTDGPGGGSNFLLVHQIIGCKKLALSP